MERLPLPCIPCKLPSDPYIPNVFIRGDKTPTNLPQTNILSLCSDFRPLFLHCHIPHQPFIHGDYPLGWKLPSNPLILHVLIRGDKTPTNFRRVFLHCHTPHHVGVNGEASSIFVYFVNYLQIPIFLMSTSVGTKPPSTAYQYFITFPSDFEPLFFILSYSPPCQHA